MHGTFDAGLIEFYHVTTKMKNKRHVAGPPHKTKDHCLKNI
jgi:hypothetical protein